MHLLRKQGLSYDAVARRVGSSVKTVYREMRRDRGIGVSYGSGLTQRTHLGFKFD